MIDTNRLERWKDFNLAAYDSVTNKSEILDYKPEMKGNSDIDLYGADLQGVHSTPQVQSDNRTMQVDVMQVSGTTGIESYDIGSGDTPVNKEVCADCIVEYKHSVHTASSNHQKISKEMFNGKLFVRKCHNCKCILSGTTIQGYITIAISIEVLRQS